MSECDSCQNCPARAHCNPLQIKSSIAYYNSEQARKRIGDLSQLVSDLEQALSNKINSPVVKVINARELLRAWREKEGL